MKLRKSLLLASATDGGRFTDATGPLLPLFSDPDGRGGRRWKEVFGLEHPRTVRRGQGYLAREMRQFN